MGRALEPWLPVGRFGCGWLVLDCGGGGFGGLGLVVANLATMKMISCGFVQKSSSFWSSSSFLARKMSRILSSSREKSDAILDLTSRTLVDFGNLNLSSFLSKDLIVSSMISGSDWSICFIIFGE